MREKRSILIFAACLSVYLLCFYSQELIGNRSFYLGDITYFFEPQLRYIRDAISHGRLPLWNSLNYCGMPQIAIPSPGIFYPLNWLFIALPFNCAYALNMVLHQLIAGLGMYLLISYFEWGAVPACIAGAAFALNGYMFGLQSNYTLVASASFIPLAIYFMLRTRWRKGNIMFPFAALTICLMLAAGRPEVSGLGALTLVVVAVAAFIHSHSFAEDDAVARFWLLAAALISGMLLSLFALAPVLEWIPQSPRVAGLVHSDIVAWSARFYDWLLMLLPQPLGDPTPFYGSPIAELALAMPGRSPYLDSAFVGPVFVAAAIWGMLTPGFSGKRLVLLIFAFTALLAMGDHAFLFKLVESMTPALSMIRYPIKLIVFPIGCLCLLAAFGMKRALTKDLRLIDQISAAAFFIALAAFSAVALLAPAAFLFPVQSADTQALVVQAQHLIGQSGLFASLSGLTLCAFQYVYQEHHIGRTPFILVALFGVIGSLIVYSTAFEMRSAPANFFAKKSTIEERLAEIEKADNLSNLNARTLTIAEQFQALPRSKTASIDHLELDRNYLRPFTNMDANVSHAFGYEGAATREYFAFGSELIARYDLMGLGRANAARFDQRAPEDPILARFCQLSATRYIITPATNHDDNGTYERPRLNPEYFELVSETKPDNSRIYKFKKFKGRAYFAERVTYEPALQVVFNKLIDPDATKFDLEHETILQSNPEFLSAVSSSTQTEEGSQSETEAEADTVSVLSDSGEHLKLSTRCQKARLLVIGDQYYPGWKATIDGSDKEIAIARANACSRAIVVPAGAHTIEFSYAPESLIEGAVAAGLGLLIVIAVQVLIFKSAPATTGDANAGTAASTVKTTRNAAGSTGGRTKTPSSDSSKQPGGEGKSRKGRKGKKGKK